MKSKIIIAAFLAGASTAAHASLQVTTSSSPGSYCYSECTQGGIGCATLKRYEGTNYTASMDPCLSSIGDVVGGVNCFVGSTGNNYFFCTSSESACSSVGEATNAQTPGNWTNAGGNRVSRPIYQYQDTYDECYPSVSRTEYGCASGYYTNSTSGSSSMICTACPANATCGGDGNVEIFKCNDGYYRNGGLLSCTECPTSGGISAKTGKTGATAITECYIPAGSAFTDTKGSGTYTDNCYYTN